MSKNVTFPEKREEVYQFLNDLAMKARLLERGRGVIETLTFLYRTYPHVPSNKVMARWTGIAVPTLAALKGELIKAGLLETKREFTRKGLQWVEQVLGLKWKGYPYPLEFSSDLIRPLVPWTESIPPCFDQLSSQLQAIFARRPKVDVTLDQAKATVTTVIKRVAFLLQFSDLEGLNVLILGDDDALSLALCATDLPRQVTVIDVDDRILNFIWEEFEQLNPSHVKLKIINADLREELPAEARKNHDVFFTDPPYTFTGMLTFFTRGLEGLHPESPWARGYICASRKPLTMLTFQKYCIEMGWHVSLYIPNFNRYEGNTRYGNSSSLIRMDPGKSDWHQEILDQIPMESRFYTKEDFIP